ncbi:MAG: DNA adenine methylase [Hyphomicrobiaceae bacterium]
MNAAIPTRPALRWHGGKFRLAPWIIGHFPPHRVYVEPFGGAGSVLLRKARSYAEIYNDLDEGVVNLFRVLREPEQASRCIELLRLTPFARAEFDTAYELTDDPIERARRLVIRSFMGFGSDGHNERTRTGFRANSNRSNTTPAHDWANYPAALAAIVERLQGVVIECRDALDVMRQHDGPETLHYVDPPYLPETRSAKSRRGRLSYHAYAHEMDTEGHERLLDALQSLTGTVILSGYPSALYDDALHDWRRVERPAMADGARPRTEVLWISRDPYPDLLHAASAPSCG